MPATRYVVGDVASVAGGLQVTMWGQVAPTRVRLHSGHPLEVGDRVYLTEIEQGIWMCLGPLETSVDYFPLPEDVDPETDPPPLVITAGTVTNDGDNIDLNDGTRCPYTGTVPDPNNEKVVTFSVDGACVELPDDPSITSDPTPRTVTPTGNVAIVDAATGNVIDAGEVGVTLRVRSTLVDRAGNRLSGERFVWYRGGQTLTVATRDYAPTAAGEYQVGVTASVGGVTYSEVRSQTVTLTISEDPEPNTPAQGDLVIAVGGTAGPVPGALLVADTSNITDTEGLDDVVWNYSWVAPGIVSFDSSLTIPQGTAAGTEIVLTVTFQDDEGNNETKTTSLRVVAPGDRPPAGSPTIEGTALGGSSLAADVSTISDPDGLTNPNYRYAWTFDGDPAATTSTLQIPRAQRVGTVVGLAVTFTDDNDNTYTRVAASVTVAQGQNREATGSPRINGDPSETSFVTASVGTITDPDGYNPNTVTWVWLVAGIIRGRDRQFQIPDNTASDMLELQARFVDDFGNEEGPLVANVRRIGARTRAPGATLQVAPQDITASVAITATNLDDWRDADTIEIRRRVGGATSRIWPVAGARVQYRDFTQPTPPATSPTYTAMVTGLIPDFQYSIELWVNGQPRASATFRTKESEGAQIVGWRVNTSGTNWFNIQGFVRIVNWDAGTQIRFRANRSFQGGPFRQTVATGRLAVSSIVAGSPSPQGNVGLFNFFDVPPCGRYQLIAELFQGGVLVDTAQFDHTLRKATQSDLAQALRNRNNLQSILTESGRVENALETAIREFQEAWNLLNAILSFGFGFRISSYQRNLRLAEAALERAQTAITNAENAAAGIEDLILDAVGTTAFDVPSQASVVAGGGVVLAGIGIAAVGGLVALTGVQIFLGTSATIAYSFTTGGVLIGINVFGIIPTAFNAAGLASALNTGAIATGTTTTTLTGGAIAAFGFLFAGIGAALGFAAFDDIKQEARLLRNRIYQPEQAEQVVPGFQGVIPGTPESGYLLEVRQRLAAWRASPIGRANFAPTVTQAQTFVNVVTTQLQRTDCR